MFLSLIPCLCLAQAGTVHIPTVWQMEMNECLVTLVKSSSKCINLECQTRFSTETLLYNIHE